MRGLTLSGPKGASRKEAGATFVPYQDLDSATPSGEAWGLMQIVTETGVWARMGEEKAGCKKCWEPNWAGAGPGRGWGPGDTQVSQTTSLPSEPQGTGLASATCPSGAWHLWPHPAWGWHRTRMQRTFQKEGRKLTSPPACASHWRHQGARPPCSTSFTIAIPQGLVQGLLQGPYSLALLPWVVSC